MNLLRSRFVDNSDREVNVQQVAVAVASNSHTLLDVREHDEWEEGRIEGSIHIPMGEIMNRANEIPADKPIYTVCHSGARSLYVIDPLVSMGHEQPKSLAGGIVAWAQAGKPVVR